MNSGPTTYGLANSFTTLFSTRTRGRSSNLCQLMDVGRDLVIDVMPDYAHICRLHFHRRGHNQAWIESCLVKEVVHGVGPMILLEHGLLRKPAVLLGTMREVLMV